MFFITFDEFYDINQYNSFLSAAKNNGVELKEWINVRPPYNWYIELDGADMPKFVDFEIASSQDERYLVKKIEPQTTKDIYPLKRRETDAPTEYDRFIMNDYLTEAQERNHMTVFRYRSKEELIEISRSPEMKDTKIYMLGRLRNWNVAVCTNKFIEGHIQSDWILLSESSKKKLSDMGDLEAYINYYILRSDKISEKHFKTHYVKNGKYVPVMKTAGV